MSFPTYSLKDVHLEGGYTWGRLPALSARSSWDELMSPGFAVPANVRSILHHTLPCGASELPAPLRGLSLHVKAKTICSHQVVRGCTGKHKAWPAGGGQWQGTATVLLVQNDCAEPCDRGWRWSRYQGLCLQALSHPAKQTDTGHSVTASQAEKPRRCT